MFVNAEPPVAPAVNAIETEVPLKTVALREVGAPVGVSVVAETAEESTESPKSATAFNLM